MTIPAEIDFAELSRAVDANDASARIIARSLRRACHVDGVFYLQLGQKGIKIEKFALEHARDFFSLPLEEKNKISNLHSAQYRGYIAHGKERTQGQPDFREQLEFGVEMPPAQLREADALWKRLIGPNQWPSIKYFRKDFESIVEDLGALCLVEPPPFKESESSKNWRDTC